MDPLEAVFVFCFVFGVATSLLSLALGAFHGGDGGHGAHSLGAGHGAGHLGLGGEGHGGGLHAGGTGAGHGAGHALGHGAGHALGHGSLSTNQHSQGAIHEGHFGEVSPLNLQTITAFLACFGGTGWVVYGSAGLAPALALIVASAAGLAGGGVVFWFLVKVLIAGQQFMDPADTIVVGTVGRVTLPLHEGTTGEIIFSRNGARHSEGARSATGQPIEVGTEVVIVRYEGGLAYVEPWTTYSGES